MKTSFAVFFVTHQLMKLNVQTASLQMKTHVNVSSVKADKPQIYNIKIHLSYCLTALVLAG